MVKTMPGVVDARTGAATSWTSMPTQWPIELLSPDLKRLTKRSVASRCFACVKVKPATNASILRPRLGADVAAAGRAA